jgi:hypothetical protein
MTDLFKKTSVLRANLSNSRAKQEQTWSNT